MTKAERSRALRYKRPALVSLGFYDMRQELWNIQDACSEVVYFVERDDGTLLDALDGDQDDEVEFKMAFSDLSSKADDLLDKISEFVDGDEYDDCTVALIGNRYNLMGFDNFEEDYYHLCGYDGQLACTEAGKRLMRKTKAEIISTVGQCLGILLAYLDLRQQYDYLKATMDILRDENTSVLRTVSAIEDAYERAEAVGFLGWKRETDDLDRLLMSLPDRVWVEG